MLLSACVIAKDEAASLPRCLGSVKDLVDEVVVCDTGSTDDTVAVAEAAGARVVRGTWPGSFAEARNAALAHCQGTWVLAIDADEEAVADGPRLDEPRRRCRPSWRVARTAGNPTARRQGLAGPGRLALALGRLDEIAEAAGALRRVSATPVAADVPRASVDLANGRYEAALELLATGACEVLPRRHRLDERAAQRADGAGARPVAPSSRSEASMATGSSNQSV